MKYRLAEQHYMYDQVLEPGTEIGDDTPFPHRAPKDDLRTGRKRGDRLPPSRAMIPMDDEAKKDFKAKFGEEAPSVDPTMDIPLHSGPNSPTVKAKPGPVDVDPLDATKNPKANEKPSTTPHAPAPTPLPTSKA